MLRTKSLELLQKGKKKKVKKGNEIAQDVVQAEEADGITRLFLESTRRTELWNQRKDSSFEKSQQNLRSQQAKGNENGNSIFSIGYKKTERRRRF